MKLPRVVILSSMCSLGITNGYGMHEFIKNGDTTILFDDQGSFPSKAPYDAFKQKMDLAVTEECMNKIEDYEWGRIKDNNLFEYFNKNKDSITIILKRLSHDTNPQNIYQLSKIGLYTKNTKLLNDHISLIQKYAEQDIPKIQYVLGRCYDYGTGIEKDHSKAIEYYQKAADLGHVVAQYKLGRCYHYGKGIEKNPTKAFEWYQTAANQGHAIAQYRVGCCYYSADGVEVNFEKAIEWWEKAAKQGHAFAQYQLGFCYHHGTGVEKDHSKAVECYQKAADLGHEKAREELNKLKKSNHHLFQEENNENVQEQE